MIVSIPTQAHADAVIYEPAGYVLWMTNASGDV